MPKPFSPEERNQIQQLILEKSKELFMRFGFEKITIADITEATDIGKGTFYQFYKSKGELFVDVYAREWRRLQEELLQKYKGYSGDIAEIVLSYIRDNRKNLLGSPVLSIIYQRGTLKHISDKYGTQGLKEFSELNRGRCKIDEQSSMEQRSLFVSSNRKADSEESAIRGIINYANKQLYYKRLYRTWRNLSTGFAIKFGRSGSER